MKKIFILITQSQWGGAQRYVFDLAKNLKQEYDITVGCGGDGPLIEKLKKENIKVKVFNNLVRSINLVKDFICFWQIFGFIRKNKFEIVHTNSSKAEILGNISAKLAGCKKVVFTAHGFVFNEPMSKLKKRFFVSIEKFANLFSDKIICVSKFDQKTALQNKIAPEKKLVVIYNGINKKINEHESLAFSRDTACLPVGRSNGGVENRVKKREREQCDFVVGTVANFYPVKGLEYLIQSAKIVIEHDKQVKFVVCGDGELRSKLESLIKELKISDNFILKGFCDNILKEISAFDLFVMTSLKEGLPYALLEAQSLKIPAIATRVGGIPEIIDENKTGFLIGPKEVEELAQKILYLKNNKNIAKSFSDNGFEKVTKNFNINKMIEKIKKLIYEW